jgi:hypothetical protein
MAEGGLEVNSVWPANKTATDPLSSDPLEFAAPFRVSPDLSGVTSSVMSSTGVDLGIGQQRTTDEGGDVDEESSGNPAPALSGSLRALAGLGPSLVQ